MRGSNSKAVHFATLLCIWKTRTTAIWLGASYEKFTRAIDCTSSRLCYSLHELIKIGEKTITILLSMYFKEVLLLVLSSILKIVHNCLVFPTYTISVTNSLSTTELQTKFSRSAINSRQ